MDLSLAALGGRALNKGFGGQNVAPMAVNAPGGMNAQRGAGVQFVQGNIQTAHQAQMENAWLAVGIDPNKLDYDTLMAGPAVMMAALSHNDFIERVRQNAKPALAGPQRPVPAILGVRG
jgi:hypothetical protein